MTSQLALARERLGGRRRARPGAPHVVGVISGRGGTGVSLFAAVLAIRSARSGLATLLVDADPWLDTQRIWLGQPHRHAPSDAILRQQGPEALVTALHDSLELASLGRGGVVEPERRALLRRIPSIFERRSVVVVDAGSRLEGLERCLDLRVGSILVISASDAMSLASTHALIKAAREMSELDLSVAFNRVHRDEARAGAAVLEEGARRFLGYVPRIVGPVGLDAGLQERLATGATLLQGLVESSLPDQIADLMPELRPWTPT